MMHDYLCHIADLDAEAASVTVWATKVEDQWTFHLPPLCDCLPVLAYTDMGTPPDEEDVGYVAPTEAPGQWFIVSIGTGNPLPEVVQQYVVADGERKTGLMLPDNVQGLSTIWAGMTIIPTP